MSDLPHLSYTPSKQFLLGKVILVTGAGDGIGKQAALDYAKFGATVILLGKTVKKLEATYDEIEAAGGQQPAIVPIDFLGATEKHYVDMAATINDQFACLDGILFNASILGSLCPFSQIKEKEWNDVLQVNVTSQFLMMKALMPLMTAHAKQTNVSPSVIFTTSSVGRKGRAYWGSYAISKFATEGMMQVLADENINTNIRFNCINPGGTRTTMRAKAFPAENPQTLKTPAEIMSTYLYLMDPAVSITGQSLNCQPK